jgi:uncharacterized protein YjiS (DUF1127 family)
MGTLTNHRLSNHPALPSSVARLVGFRRLSVHVATHTSLTQCQVSTQSTPVRPARQPGRLSRTFATWRRRIAERQAFADLDDRDLRDMSLSRWEVEGERAKPFWRG